MFEREQHEREEAKTMTVRFTVSELAALKRMADRLGLKGRVGVIRRALAHFIDTDKRAKSALKEDR
jgi:hypothetical protein